MEAQWLALSGGSIVMVGGECYGNFYNNDISMIMMVTTILMMILMAMVLMILLSMMILVIKYDIVLYDDIDDNYDIVVNGNTDDNDNHDFVA